MINSRKDYNYMEYVILTTRDKCHFKRLNTGGIALFMRKNTFIYKVTLREVNFRSKFLKASC